MIDDVLHKGGVGKIVMLSRFVAVSVPLTQKVSLADLFIGGHIHVYQRFYPLRSSPYGPNASDPNNIPADVDFDCASTSSGKPTLSGERSQP